MTESAAFAPWADPAQKPLIEIRSVTKRFGDFAAVKSLDLDIYEREFFAILGPSGCGKTTLMRMLAGFETPTEGAIRLDGADLVAVPPAKRPVNMMFQSYALFPHLNVEQNIAFGLRREGMEKDRIAERVSEMIRLTQLAGFERRRPDQLSGGQKQRVALARALAKRPRLVLLDEPLGALDKKLRQETQFELMGIQEQLGATFVIVTHDQEEAMTVSSRIAVMKEGELMQVAPPVEMYEAPNSRFVADFIGDVSLIEGRIIAVSEGSVSVIWHDGDPPLSVSAEHWPAIGAPVAVALRPEKVHVSKEEPRDAVNAVRGKVLDIAYLGNITTYHVELPTGEILKAQETNRNRAAQRNITWDDQVWASWARDGGVLLTA